MLLLVRWWRLIVEVVVEEIVRLIDRWLHLMRLLITRIMLRLAAYVGSGG